jgi:hypothetical protein
MGDKFAVFKVVCTLAFLSALPQIMPALMECENMRLEQGLVNFFRDGPENKYVRFRRPRGHGKIKYVDNTIKQHLHKFIYYQITCIVEYNYAQSDFWGN